MMQLRIAMYARRDTDMLAHQTTIAPYAQQARLEAALRRQLAAYVRMGSS
jgi:hypothetical protein